MNSINTISKAIALALCLSLTARSFAEKPPFVEADDWVGVQQLSFELPQTETPDVTIQQTTFEQVAPPPPAPPVLPERPLPEEPLIPATEPTPLIELETETPIEIEPETIGRHPYTSPGWYSFPAWNRTTWRRGSNNRFGDFSFEGVSAEPIESWDGLSYTHGSAIHFLDGPMQTDMPPRLFEFQSGLHWFGDVADNARLDLAFSVGLYTDFEDSVRQGWRFPAHAVVSWDVEREFQPVTGVRFFDREDLGLLPVVGVIVQPDEKTRLELLFPEPRVAWRVGDDPEKERWISLSGQIGGGAWAIERRPSGLADVATYNDYQFVLALDTISKENSVSSIEFGYAFSRELLYKSNVGNYNPADTIFVRFSSRK